MSINYDKTAVLNRLIDLVFQILLIPSITEIFKGCLTVINFPLSDLEIQTYVNVHFEFDCQNLKILYKTWFENMLIIYYDFMFNHHIITYKRSLYKK